MLPNWQQLTAGLMLPQLSGAVLELVLKTMLTRAYQRQHYLPKLAGKVLKLALQQPHFTVYLAFSSQQVDVLRQYEATPDCTVTTTINTLFKFPKKSELTQYINDQSIVLEGDLQLLQDFMGLLESIEKDPAEWLAPYVGDVVAYNSCRAVKQGASFIHQQVKTSQHHWQQRLTEEWQVAAPKQAVNHFSTEVQQLEQRLLSLTKKIEWLADKVKR